jgi:predicted nucleic acid-binding protein
MKCTSDDGQLDTNILVYATLSVPLAKTDRARELLVRVDDRTIIDAWRGVLPVQGTEDDDLSAALGAVKKHRLAFWDAMLWAAVTTGWRPSSAHRGSAGRFCIGGS